MSLFPVFREQGANPNEQSLRKRNPFAHWAVARCLHRLKKKTSAPTPGLQFLIEPLRDLLGQQRRDLKALLLHLQMLEIRFERMYRGVEDIDWTLPLPTTRRLYDRLVSKLPHEVALIVTEEDRCTFRLFSLSSIVDHDIYLQESNKRCNHLCEAVRECAVPESGLRPNLEQFLQVRLEFSSRCKLDR